MNIGIVCFPTFGGSGVIATELGKALAEKGHNIHFITYNQPARLFTVHKNIFFHEVNVIDYPLFEYAPYELCLASKMVDVAINAKLDFLHIHYAIPHASAAYLAKQILAKKKINLPYITTLHGTDITLVGKDPSFSPIISFAINNSDAVSSVSNYLKDLTYKNFEIKRDIKVIPNFVCIDENKKISGKVFRKSFSPNGEKILIHVSNFRKVKRVTDIIRIFDIVSKKINSKLILVGDGPERYKTEELCRELNLCDKIYFMGKVVDPRPLLAASDIFILTSGMESFGLAALEAMSMKVPVISSNKGGITEVNIHNKTGFLADVGDYSKMAEYAIKLLSNNELLNKFKQNAFLKAKEFDIKIILKKYEELYMTVLMNKKVKIDC